MTIKFENGHFVEDYAQMDDTGKWVDMVATDDLPNPCEDEHWAEQVLRQFGDLCGCVDLDPLLAPMTAYLRMEWGSYNDTIIHFDSGDPLQLLIASLATSAGFVEHGGNIGGSWLTPEGTRWLELAAIQTCKKVIR